ncbi:MAG: NFACT family protein [Synergistota bacterium]|nr:NFACT family protein [Synergistota bacterium]
MWFGPEMTGRWSLEINEIFNGARCVRAAGGSQWLALGFSQQTDWLFFSWNPSRPGCCLAAPDEVRALKESFSSTPSFTSAVTSHICGSRLSTAEQIGFDRILALRFNKTIGAGFLKRISLIMETAGTSVNMILLDAENHVLECDRRIFPEESRKPPRIPGVSYSTPEPFPGPLPTELVPRIRPTPHGTRGIGAPLVKLLWRSWHLYTPNRWKQAMEKTAGPAIFREAHLRSHAGVPFVFPLVLPETKELDGGALVSARSRVVQLLMANLVDTLRKEMLKPLAKRERSLTNSIDALQRRLEDSSLSEQWKNFGNLLLSNPDKVKRGMTSVSLYDWQTENQVTIRLNPHITPADNASRYFTKYKKQVRASREIEIQLARSIRERKMARSEKEQIELLDDIIDINSLVQEKRRPSGKKRKTRPSAPPHRVFRFGDREFYAGLNERGNRWITFSLANPGDIWFHARNTPGSHVLLNVPDSTSPSEEHILFGASLAAYYSKARLSGKVAVDYTERKHVRSRPDGGKAEVLYDHFGTVTVSPELWKENMSETELDHPAGKTEKK